MVEVAHHPRWDDSIYDFASRLAQSCRSDPGKPGIDDIRESIGDLDQAMSMHQEGLGGFDEVYDRALDCLVLIVRGRVGR